MSAWIDDLCRSRNWVVRNLDIVCKMLNTDADNIFPCEGEADALRQHLDKQCGTDYFIHNRFGHTFAVGSRFQNDARQEKKWATFTIRATRESGVKTEFEKLKDAIQRDSQRPHLTMQGYVTDDGNLDRMAVAMTRDIVDYIEKYNPEIVYTRKDQNGQSGFYPVNWDDFMNKGYYIRIYKDGEIKQYSGGKLVA